MKYKKAAYTNHRYIASKIVITVTKANLYSTLPRFHGACKGQERSFYFFGKG